MPRHYGMDRPCFCCPCLCLSLCLLATLVSARTPPPPTLRPGKGRYPARTPSGIYPSARIRALSCPNPLWPPPIGPDKGLILPEPPLATTLRPGYRPYPARTRAGGGPDEPPKLVRIFRQPPLFVLSGGGAPVPGDFINRSSNSQTCSEPPRLVMRGGESPSRQECNG